MPKTRLPDPLPWTDVEPYLDRIMPVEGGFSLARRGLVAMPDRDRVFVKIGTEDNSIEWAEKEIAVYRYLQSQSFPAIPAFLGAKPDCSAFIIEALDPQDGWDWSDTWTDARLTATLAAIDGLAQLRPKDEPWMSMGQLALDESRDGWAILAESPDLQQALLAKLQLLGRSDISTAIDFGRESWRSSQFIFRRDVLVHYDVRADNCAWNAATGQAKLVDWNWAQMGDARVDTASLLVNVHKSGLDVRHTQAGRLDNDSLHWLAGFWFKAAATPIWPGGQASLRDFQLQSATTAFELAGCLN